jgi:site-specific DNA-methyltransferase (adenine-specific)
MIADEKKRRTKAVEHLPITESATMLARKREAPSTVGRGRVVARAEAPSESEWHNDLVHLYLGDSLQHYRNWPSPTVIVSDGGYGVLGFDGDSSDHLGLPQWYEPHVAAWARHSTPQTTLWFWNSEVGWAAVHPVLEKYGWRYVNANVWNKGKAHIAGNVNTQKIRRFPVVTEVCVQYVLRACAQGLPLKEWLLQEWKRTGLALRKANEACGVADVAVRKYLDQNHLWYFPPPEMFAKMQEYANLHGVPEGRPYFSLDGVRPATAEDWARMRSKFNCPHGFTNVWDRPPLHGSERVKLNGNSGRAIHLNQKPVDLVRMTIEASSDEGDVVWEPFGGLFSVCVSAHSAKRRCYSAEIDPTYFHYGVERVKADTCQPYLS